MRAVGSSSRNIVPNVALMIPAPMSATSTVSASFIEGECTHPRSSEIREADFEATELGDARDELRALRVRDSRDARLARIARHLVVVARRRTSAARDDAVARLL